MLKCRKKPPQRMTVLSKWNPLIFSNCHQIFFLKFSSRGFSTCDSLELIENYHRLKSWLTFELLRINKSKTFGSLTKIFYPVIELVMGFGISIWNSIKMQREGEQPSISLLYLTNTKHPAAGEAGWCIRSGVLCCSLSFMGKVSPRMEKGVSLWTDFAIA